MGVILYTNYSDDDVVNKNIIPMPYGQDNIIPCKLVFPTDYMKPSIDLGTPIDISSINYMYIEELKAFYKIINFEVLNNHIVRLYGEYDELLTWKKYIRGITCLVERYEFVNEVSNNYGNIVDEQIVSRIDRSIKQQKLCDVGGNATGTHIAITVTGGVE